MQKITSVDELKNAIQLLETEQKNKGKLLRENVLQVYERLKPANLIRTTIKDLFSSSFQLENISGISAGLASGFLANRLFIGKSGSTLKKLLGSILQYGMTSIIAQKADLIKAFGQVLFQHLFGKKK